MVLTFDRCAIDPKYFIKILYDGMGFVLTPQHYLMIDNFINYRSNLQLQSRGLGVTTLAAGLLLWKALFQPDYTIAITSPTTAEAIEVLHIIRTMIAHLPKHLTPKMIEMNKQSLRFENYCRIVVGGMSSMFMRGMSISMLYCDNFSGASPKTQQEFLDCNMPVVARSSVFISSDLLTDDPFGHLWGQSCISPGRFRPQPLVGNVLQR